MSEDEDKPRHRFTYAQLDSMADGYKLFDLVAIVHNTRIGSYEYAACYSRYVLILEQRLAMWREPSSPYSDAVRLLIMVTLNEPEPLGVHTRRLEYGVANHIDWTFTPMVTGLAPLAR